MRTWKTSLKIARPILTFNIMGDFNAKAGLGEHQSPVQVPLGSAQSTMEETPSIRLRKGISLKSRTRSSKSHLPGAGHGSPQ